MSGSKLLIVNADDFGRSPGINRAIIRAHRDGVVTSTTLMVNLPWTMDAVRSAADVPGLGIGLHLNLCYGKPIAPPDRVPTLVDLRGSFKTGASDLVREARSGDIDKELRAQLNRFQELLGRMPTHIDSHKYLHSRKPFLSVVADLASNEGLPVRVTGDGDRRTLRRYGVATPDHFEGRFHGAEGAGVDQAVIGLAIEELESGTTELMCHPGIVDEHLSDSSYRDDRERELAVLCSAETAELLHRRSVRLVTYRALAKTG